MSEAWPRRNLGRAEHWGRTVEARVDGLTTTRDRQAQSQDGLGRVSGSSADTLQELAEQLRLALEAVPTYFSRGASASGFGFGNSWITVADSTVNAPAGQGNLEIQAVGVCTSYQSGGAVGSKFIWPFSLSSVTSEFGPRPPLPFHSGIDFGQSTGTPIPVTHNGTVTLRANYPDWGNYMRVDCSSQVGIAGSWTGYAHMNSPGLYPPGTTVTQGQTIGYVGSTGYVTGPHLHYETAPGGTRIDPRQFMDTFNSTTVTLTRVEARIVINGVASPTFQPYTEMGISQNQVNYPVFGVSLSGVSTVRVELQIRAVGSSVVPNAANIANLTVRGGFQRG